MRSPLGHADLHNFIIKDVFPHFNDYYYMLERTLYEKTIADYGISKDLPVVFFPDIKIKMHRISLWISYFMKMRFIADFIQRNNIACVYFLSYDTLALSWYRRKLENTKIILMNHDNIARFDKNIARRFFMKRLKECIHVLYCGAEEPASRFLLPKRLGFRKVITLEHYIDDSRKITIHKRFTANSVILYAPSTSNDDTKIMRVLDSQANSQMIIKAKVRERTFAKYQNKYGKNLFSGYLPNTEFEKDMNNADFVLLPYPDDYNYRTSGILFDAIAYEKPVLTDNKYLYKIYLEKNGLGIYVEDLLTLNAVVANLDATRYSQLVDNIKAYKLAYSSEKIGSHLAAQICKIMNG